MIAHLLKKRVAQNTAHVSYLRVVHVAEQRNVCVPAVWCCGVGPLGYCEAVVLTCDPCVRPYLMLLLSVFENIVQACVECFLVRMQPMEYEKEHC